MYTFPELQQVLLTIRKLYTCIVLVLGTVSLFFTKYTCFALPPPTPPLPLSTCDMFRVERNTHSIVQSRIQVASCPGLPTVQFLQDGKRVCEMRSVSQGPLPPSVSDTNIIHVINGLSLSPLFSHTESDQKLNSGKA